ncbi:putative integral membrane protein [Microbacterium esteraromaticum]|uniref:Putative integral membrane protein n=1 Tax=Microbacterium esteraromaticum TaxID=57043 RepID=A0A1R4IZ12_9MICO|nr:SCO6880 family protein [Microbacterium esteraromaticum]SJN25106.1 putative integral membrane protein [Microbacterium esteraromaticum]
MSERLYGNVQEPHYARTMGLSMASVALVIAGGVSTFFMMQFFGVPIHFAAIALLLAIVGVWFLETGRKQGRTRLERAVGARMFRKAKKKGATTYLSGPTSRMPDGSHRAPGLLASTEMFEGTDHLGRPFAFLWDRVKRTGTVFFTAASSGLDLQDQDTIDFLVDGWGGYLHQSSTLAALEQVSVTVTSMRDTGERLPAAVAEHRSRVDASVVPTFSREAVDEIVAAVNAGTGRVDARLAVTFSGAPDADQGLEARSREDLMGEVMVHLPAMIEQLELSGGGVVSYLAAQEIIDTTYVAYNPEAAVAVERARLSGVGTGLTWEEVGPVYANADNIERYEHGAGFSQSFQVWRAPAGVFRESSMMALLKPDDISEQKRVTILYRPMTMEQSQSRVQTAVADADYETNQKGRKATGAQLASAGRVKQTETEVSARGAALIRFSFIITVTVMDPAALRRVPSMVRNAAQTGVQLSVRPATGNEDASFAIGLGLGIVPAKWATVSPQLRQAL